jgi:long-chain fatty acid transport protein
MTAVRGFVSVTSLAALLALVASPAWAQSNDEVFPQFQWNFSTPGARANAMGRAFTGLADDASAAVTNPAGLMSLTRPQAYFEYDSNDLRVARLSAVNSFVSLSPTTTSQTVNAPAFFSLSAPIGKKLAVAFTRHEFLNYRENFTLAPRPVPGAITAGFTEFPVTGASNFSATSYDGSVAYAVTSQLRVGVTFGEDHLNATSSAQRFALACSPKGCADTFGVTERLVNGQPLLVNQTSINSSSSGASFTAGALFVPNDKLSVGLQFSRGPKLSVAEHLQVNPGFLNLATDTNQTPVEFSSSPFTVPINVPNRFGFGAAYRANSRLLATVDFVWIGYSSLASQFVVVIDSATLSPSQYSIPNVVESHLGAEYLLLTGKHPIFIRGGFFTSPDHSVTFTPLATPVNADTSAAQTAINDLLPRKTTFAGTVGAGFVFGQHAQLDLAYVGTREFVASLGARF